MIHISLSVALGLYSAVLAVVVLAIWVYTEITVRRSYRILEKQFLWRCVFCGYIYLDEGAEDVSQCPQCDSYNAAADKHARYVRTSSTRKPPESQPSDAGASRRNTSHRKRPHQRRRGPRKH